jgi:radical SAM superfamily enzyme YgiQ (UPF0313 family)
MSKVPTPRYDMLKADRYMFGCLQISRGCPFQCEFCDIIVTFGRRPRMKTAGQVVAELDMIHATGVRDVFVVDDNLIGNKRAIKEILPVIVEWQKRHDYALSLFTEASLDLAEEPELRELMVEANFLAVFVGIESPSEESLRETRKFQNVRKGAGLVERVHTIQDSGLDVWCGMIVGFDSDGPEIFGAQERFLTQARITNAMVGPLYAIPKTPLHARLAKEGRLDTSDTSGYGTNVIPLKMTREQLRKGYIQVMSALVEPGAYFAPHDSLYLRKRIPYAAGRAAFRRKRPWRQLRAGVYDLAVIAVLFARLMLHVKDPALRREYRRRVWDVILARRDPGLTIYYLIKCAMHYHLHTLVKGLSAGRMVSSFEAVPSGTVTERELVAVE